MLPELYNKKVTAGEIVPDADQAKALAALQGLLPRLTEKKAGIWSRLFAPELKGFYFYGDVGRGKSMVMDLFFANAPLAKKRRVHFHAFMLEVHDFLHAARQSRSAAGRGGGAKEAIDGDLIACADKIAAEARLLCFDEFFVKDVADAMILGRLFTALFARGVVVVMTSNTAPDDLYLDGLQRDRFLPFIALLKEKMNILRFGGEKDYRLNTLRDGQLYFWPHDEDAAREMDKVIDKMADGRPVEPVDIAVKGRVIHVPQAVREVASFTFEDLCGQPKSALDYLELIKRFSVFVVRDVPYLDDNRRDATTRFITLIDTLYDNHARLVMSAAAAPDRLYRGEVYAGTFSRTVSRLVEMQSREYRSK